MMKQNQYVLLLLLMVSLFCRVKAQTNVAGMFAPSNHMENSFLQPSLIGSEYKSFKISILPVYAGVNANFTSIGDLIDYSKAFQTLRDSGSISNYTPLHRMMNGLKNNNIIYAGADITLLNIGLNIRRKMKSFLDLEFSARQHAQVQFNFNKELAYLLYKGNQYYENQTIDILPKGNILQYGDYGINIAKTFMVPSSSGKAMKVKPALRLRYLVGNAHLSTEKSSLNVYTATDGRYIDVALDGIIQQSYFRSNDWTKNSTYTSFLKKGAGSGFAWDAGITLQPNDRLSLSLAMIDNGSIRFTKNAMSISAKGSVRWEGYDLNHPIDTLFNLNNLFSLDSTQANYSIPLGTKLSLYASYGLGQSRKLNRYSTFYPHNLMVYFQQGFKNYLNASSNPLLAIGYSYRYKNRLNAGANVSVGGNVGLGLGAHVNIGLGPIQLGLASNSLIGLIDRYQARSLDLHVFTSLCF